MMPPATCAMTKRRKNRRLRSLSAMSGSSRKDTEVGKRSGPVKAFFHKGVRVGNEGYGKHESEERGPWFRGPFCAALKPCSVSVLSLGGRFVGRRVFRDCLSEPCNRPLCFAATGFPAEDAPDEKQEKRNHCDCEHGAEHLALRRTHPIQKILPIATLQLSPGILC